MAAKNDAVITLKKQLKDGRLGGLYLFFGEETFLKDYYIGKMMEAVPDMGFEDFNHITIEGGKDDPEALDNAIDAFPMMAEKKLVLIRASGMFKSPSEPVKRYLKKRLEQLPEDTVIVFDETAVDKRSATYKAVAKAGLAVEFAFLSETELVSWVIRTAAAAGRKIDKHTAAYLVSVCDPGLGNLSNELNKLFNAGCDPIGKSDIDRMVSKSLQVQVFDLTDCLMARDGRGAVQLLMNLKTVRESAFKLLYLLFSTFDKMLYAKVLDDEGEPYDTISRCLGVPPFIARKYISGAKGFGRQKLEELVIRVADTDLAIKQGKVDEWTALEQYVFSALEQ